MTIAESRDYFANIYRCISDFDTAFSSLLSTIIFQPKSWIWAHPEFELGRDNTTELAEYLKRSANGEPLAYIIGEKEFYGLPFWVSRDVLIPRPETEGLILSSIDYLDKKVSSLSIEQVLTIVDVGTGSGCVAVAMAKLWPTARVIAIDVSPTALTMARRNATRHTVSQIEFLEGSLLEPLEQLIPSQRVDIIVANLPYISDDEFEQLDRTVKDFEPALALRSGQTPDRLNDQLVSQAGEWLKPGGLLAYETTNGRIVLANDTISQF